MGQRLFCELAQNIMELDSSKREHKDQTYFREHLRKLHPEEHSPQLTEAEDKFLSKFFANDTANFLDKERMMLEDYKNTLFLFVNPIPMENNNNKSLHSRQHSKDNPVAIIKPLIAPSTGRQVAQTKRFQGNYIPAHHQSLHRSHKVQLKVNNIRSSNALYNGLMGKVIAIIIACSGHSPNNADFPCTSLYVFPITMVQSSFLGYH